MKFRTGLVMALSVVSLALAGCGAGKQSVNRKELFTVGETPVYMDEAWIYAKTVQQEYEKNYGTGIWGVELQNEHGDILTVEEMTKEDLLQEILQVKVLNIQASTLGIALTQEEEATIAGQAQEFIAGLTDADMAETGINQEVALQVYRENAIAQKVYLRVMEHSGVEVSEEDCRQTKIYDLYFPIYTKQGDGDYIAYTPEEAQEQYNKALEAFGRVQGEQPELTLEQAAAEYGMNESSYYTMHREEYGEQYGAEIEEQLYGLKDGQILGVVESEYGYHIMQMVSLTDQEATSQARHEQESALRQEYFQEIFEGYLDEIDPRWNASKRVDEKLWEMIVLSPQETAQE